MSGKKKPRRAEVNSRRARIAEGMRSWITHCREQAEPRRKREEKLRLLVGDWDKGGSGVTVQMREFSAQMRERIPEAVSVPHGPNRADRRARARRGGRGWQNRVPPSQNRPYHTPPALRRHADA